MLELIPLRGVLRLAVARHYCRSRRPTQDSHTHLSLVFTVDVRPFFSQSEQCVTDACVCVCVGGCVSMYVYVSADKHTYVNTNLSVYL